MTFDTIYSLGSRCQNSEILKKYNYREFSGFFDFMNTQTVESIIHILNDNFNQLLDPKNHVVLDCDVLTIDPETGVRLPRSKRTSNKVYNNDCTNIHNSIFPHHDLSSQKDYEHFLKCKKRFKALNKFNVLFNYTFNSWENDVSKTQMQQIADILNKKHEFNNFKICFICLDMNGKLTYNKIYSDKLWDLWSLSIQPFSFTGGLFNDALSNNNYISIVKTYDIKEKRITKEEIDSLI